MARPIEGKAIRVLFSQCHDELLRIGGDPEVASQVLELNQLLGDLGFEPKLVDEPLTTDHLESSGVLVLGAPRVELGLAEVEAIKRYVEGGGGLLLVSDAYTMIDPVGTLNLLAEIASLQFHEYFNYQPSWLQIFFPHYITANVDGVRINDIACISCSDGAYRLAITKATRSTVIACASVGNGRVVAAGDVDLFTDFLGQGGNRVLISNIFRWLAFRNAVDIQGVTISEKVKWGRSGTVVLKLCNGNTLARLKVECLLESDADAFVSESAKKTRTILPDKTVQMQWTVRPQVLGDQKLRLMVNVNGQFLLNFDPLLPKMLCETHGYLTLRMRSERDGEPIVNLETGDRFFAEGALCWPTDLESPAYDLDLECSEGLAVRSYLPGEAVSRWHLEAVTPGAQMLTLKVRQTDQSFSAVVTVQPSLRDELAELRAAYVHPLDAEIVQRLRAVDRRLSDEVVRTQLFNVLPPDRYVEEVYDAEAAVWIKQVLVAARREHWPNLDLLNYVLIHLAPVYLPGRGSFVPYDPVLVSHLSRLHPTAKWRLESNFVRSTETEAVNVKQSIAALLLHEKYGHGFFYTHTRLGQQLAMLYRHGFPVTPDTEPHEDFVKVIHLIEDSAVIVSEGFAAWMELTFLGTLDREVRQGVFPRRLLLLQEATGLYEREAESDFFQAFPPRFDSPYREAFEYLEYIGQTLNLRCAVQAFLIGTNIEFGIFEDSQGNIQFGQEATEIKRQLLEVEVDDARSHLRLRRISELLYDHCQDLQASIRTLGCPEYCGYYGCALARLVEGHLGWRGPHEKR